MESNYADPEELAFAFGILNHIYHIEAHIINIKYVAIKITFGLIVV